MSKRKRPNATAVSPRDLAAAAAQPHSAAESPLEPVESAESAEASLSPAPSVLKSSPRRLLVASIFGAVPTLTWSKPVIQTLLLPAHAQSSPANGPTTTPPPGSGGGGGGGNLPTNTGVVQRTLSETDGEAALLLRADGSVGELTTNLDDPDRVVHFSFTTSGDPPIRTITVSKLAAGANWDLVDDANQTTFIDGQQYAPADLVGSKFHLVVRPAADQPSGQTDAGLLYEIRNIELELRVQPGLPDLLRIKLESGLIPFPTLAPIPTTAGPTTTVAPTTTTTSTTPPPEFRVSLRVTGITAASNITYLIQINHPSGSQPTSTSSGDRVSVSVPLGTSIGPESFYVQLATTGLYTFVSTPVATCRLGDNDCSEGTFRVGVDTARAYQLIGAALTNISSNQDFTIGISDIIVTAPRYQVRLIRGTVGTGNVFAFINTVGIRGVTSDLFTSSHVQIADYRTVPSYAHDYGISFTSSGFEYTLPREICSTEIHLNTFDNLFPGRVNSVVFRLADADDADRTDTLTLPPPGVTCDDDSVYEVIVDDKNVATPASAQLPTIPAFGGGAAAGTGARAIIYFNGVGVATGIYEFSVLVDYNNTNRRDIAIMSFSDGSDSQSKTGVELAAQATVGITNRSSILDPDEPSYTAEHIEVNGALTNRVDITAVNHDAAEFTYITSQNQPRIGNSARADVDVTTAMIFNFTAGTAATTRFTITAPYAGRGSDKSVTIDNLMINLGGQDLSPAGVATRIANEINANATIPYTASASAAEVTLTQKNLGTVGNSVTVNVTDATYSTPS